MPDMSHKEKVEALRLASRCRTYGERQKKGHLVRPTADELFRIARLLERGAGVEEPRG